MYRKGPWDGIGACVKCSARRAEVKKDPEYMRTQRDLFRWARNHFSKEKQWPEPIAGSDQHRVSEFSVWFVRHEDDAADTDDWLTEAEKPFVLEAVDRDRALEVATLTGSCTRSSYCFDDIGIEAKLAVRWLPCGCRECCKFNNQACENLGQVGQFIEEEQRVLSEAGVAARYKYRREETERIASVLKVLLL